MASRQPSAVSRQAPATKREGVFLIGWAALVWMIGPRLQALGHCSGDTLGRGHRRSGPDGP